MYYIMTNIWLHSIEMIFHVTTIVVVDEGPKKGCKISVSYFLYSNERKISAGKYFKIHDKYLKVISTS